MGWEHSVVCFKLIRMRQIFIVFQEYFRNEIIENLSGL